MASVKKHKSEEMGLHDEVLTGRTQQVFFNPEESENFFYHDAYDVDFNKRTEIDAKNLDCRDINDKIKNMMSKGYGTIVIKNPGSKHSVGVGILNKLSRGEMAKLIQKSLDIPVDISCGSFKDLKPDQDFYKEAISLKCAGIASGYSDGTFGKDKPISREESLKFIIKGLEYKGLEFEIPQTESLPFLDIKDSVFKEFILKAFYAQIVDGYQDKTFKPKAYIVRQEMAKIINLARKS